MQTQFTFPTIQDHRISERTKMIQALATFRKEWEEASETKSLIMATGSVGLLLADIVHHLGFSPDEIAVILGRKLNNQVRAYTERRR